MEQRRWGVGVRGLPASLARETLGLAAGAERAGWTLEDHGADGLWVHGEGSGGEELARRWAAAAGRPSRLYAVALTPDPRGVRVRSHGVTMASDGSERPIHGASDEVVEPATDGLPALAELALRVVLEMNEHLDDQDYAIERL